LLRHQLSFSSFPAVARQSSGNAVTSLLPCTTKLARPTKQLAAFTVELRGQSIAEKM
jgi:hypothetical protein